MYLRTTITNLATSKDEIKSRFGQNRNCIRLLSSVLWDKSEYKTNIECIIIYVTKTWTVNEKYKSEINAIEME